MTSSVLPTPPGSGSGVMSSRTAAGSAPDWKWIGSVMMRLVSWSALWSAARSSCISSGRISLRRLVDAMPGAGSKKRPVLPRYWMMSNASLTTTPGGPYCSITLRSASWSTVMAGRGSSGRGLGGSASIRAPTWKSNAVVVATFFLT